MRITPSLALLLVSLSALAQAQADQWRGQLKGNRFSVVTYNVLEGFRDYRVGDPYMKGRDRLHAAQKWLREQRPDIVGLQELNGYTVESLKEDAAAWGHSYVVLLKESGYDMGLTSKSPIEVVERVVTGMHHGLLHVRVKGIDVIVTHFFPGDDNARKLREAQLVISRVEKAQKEGRECIVLGDLNASTRLDEPLFGAVAKSWYETWNWKLTDGRPFYDTLDALNNAGLTDVWAARRGSNYPQFPGRPRVDYVLATPRLAATCVSAYWADTECMHTISDHAPIVAEFRLMRH